MKSYILKRTGDIPLVFKGEIVAKACDEPPPRPDKSNYHRHWNAITVYRTDTDRFVVQVNFFSDWEGDRPFQTAYWADTQDDLVHYLTGHELEDDGSLFYDPTDFVTPIPSKAKNAEMMEGLHADFSERVSSVFEQLNIAERI